MNKVTTLLTFDEMYKDKTFYRLIFPYSNRSQYPVKQNLELINSLYLRYLKVKETGDKPRRRDIFKHWHFMEKEFYIERGYTEKEAEELKQIKIDKRKNTFNNKAPEELKEISFKKNTFNLENLKRIHPNKSIEELNTLIKERKKRAADILKNMPPEKNSHYNREKNHFCKEYYLSKGYTELEAQEILSKNAASRKISVIMERYGLSEAEAKIKQKEIIDKGLKKYYSRPIEERLEINKRRTQFSKQYSARSLKVLNRLILYLKELDNNFNNCSYLFGENELCLIDKSACNLKYYDFCIPEYKIIVEYNGLLYHPVIKDTNMRKWQNNYSRKCKI